MTFVPSDIWAMILVLLPLKMITMSKLVCQQWKSIIESSSFRDLFLSQISHSTTSWSLMCKHIPIEVLAQCGGEISGFQRSLGSYIHSFITTKFTNHPEVYRQARVVAYTDVGLVLIRVVSLFGNISYYVANPVSQECVETDSPWFEPMKYSWPLGIATRTQRNGVLLGFKVVLLFDARPRRRSLSLMIYSSDTGRWSPETVQFPFTFIVQEFKNSISLDGNLHWISRNNLNDEAVVSIDFYSGTGSVQCLVTPFPDLGKVTKFKRKYLTSSQGFLMYMNITKDDESVGEKFRLWRLKSGEWELVSEIVRENGFPLSVPFAMNPVDGKSVCFCNTVGAYLLSMNILNGQFVYHCTIARSSDGRLLLNYVQLANGLIWGRDRAFSSFVMPPWLHRIPNKVREV